MHLTPTTETIIQFEMNILQILCIFDTRTESKYTVKIVSHGVRIIIS